MRCPRHSVGFCALPSTALAKKILVNDTSTFSNFAINPCTNETFNFEGTAHVVLWDNGDLHLNWHFQGTTETGVRYISRQILNAHTNVPPPGVTDTDRFIQHYVRQGPSTGPDDLYVSQLTHVTRRPDGTFAVVHDNFMIECR